MTNQWSPQCSKQIADIYHNQPIKGKTFITQGLKALKPQLRVYRKAHWNQSFNSSSFLRDLRVPLRLEISEEEAKSRINFRVSSNVFRKIYRIKEKTGFTDSQLFEAFIYLVILRGRKSPIEPSVKGQVEEPSKIETQLGEPSPLKQITSLEKEALLDKKHLEENSEIECPYGTEQGDQIDCAKDFDEKARIHKVTRAFCRQCWERQQRKKIEHRARQVEIMKAEIHRYQERVNQTIEEQKERVIICPKTDLVIPATQCSNCDSAQQKRCERIFRDSCYQRELAKVRMLID